MSATVFLGGGRITSALIAGLRRAHYPHKIVVHDRHPEKLELLRKHHRVEAELDLSRAIYQAHLALVAVRPESIAELLRQIGTVPHPIAFVSLAAGIPIAQLRSALPKPAMWARAMPSPACRSRRGLTAVTFAKNIPKELRLEILLLFGAVGKVIEIPEKKFNAFTVTYSTSHAYHALATLASAGEKLGLDRKTALEAAAHALADGILSWRDGHLSLQALLHEAATPGGIAATAMSAMNRAGYERAVERGLRAGFERAQRNRSKL